MDPKYNKQEIADIEETAKQEARQQYAERQEKRFGRLADYSLDPENQKQYEIKKNEWEKQAEVLRNDSGFQKRAAQRREEWKKRHAVFDKENAKSEINDIKTQVADIQKQINDSIEKEKELEKKVYFDLTGSSEDMENLKNLAVNRKKSEERIDALNESIIAKQEVYKNEAEKRLLKAGIVEEIKLSKKMTPETVDALEDTLKNLREKYGIMPKGIVYSPKKVPDATASYNWLDDKIYISNKFNDIEKYADTVKKSEESLIEYRIKSGIVDIQKENLKNAEKILTDKNIKGYEREKAVISKAEAEIELNIQRMAVRENLTDTITHEYGHFIHRHADVDYVQKSKVFGAKELGGKLINGDWRYDINTTRSAKAKINAATISKYAADSPYETFAEGFLAMEKGRKIPDNVARIINEAKSKAGVKSIAKSVDSGTIKMNLQLFANKMPDEKFTQYSLNPLKAPDKAKAFKSALGYTVDNFEDLRQNILDNLVEDKFIEKGDNGYGMRYEQILELTGPNGKKAKVLTAWIQDDEDKRLVSVYVDK